MENELNYKLQLFRPILDYKFMYTYIIIMKIKLYI